MLSTFDVLLKSPLFRGLSQDELSKLMPCLDPYYVQFKKSETVIRAGDPFLGLGIVLEGEILLSKESFAGNRMILTVLKSGDMFGEMISFSDKKVWPASASAQCDTRIVFIKPERVIKQCEQHCLFHTMLIDNMLKIMSKKALMLNRKVEYLSLKSLREKLAAFFLESYHNTGKLMFVLPMNRDELADFFNVARPSISRELSKMKEDGLIDFHKSTFKISDLEALKNVL